MRLEIFTTGGTIDKLYFDAKSDYQVGEPAVGGILEEAGASIDYRVTELMRKDSLDITDHDRETIRAAVQASEASHILITHGTDSMAQTGRALMGMAGKTIVLTGALSPARFRDSDASFNIGCAVAALQCLQPGVYVTMSGRVFAADKVRKNRADNRFEEA